MICNSKYTDSGTYDINLHTGEVLLKFSTQKLVGTAKAIGKLDKRVYEVAITREKLSSDAFSFHAYIDCEDKEVGFLSFGVKEHSQLSNDALTRRQHYGTHLNGKEIVPNGENLSKIYIGLLVSNLNDKYKGIGTILMQAAIEDSLRKGCGGRIQLFASWNSPGFYYKLGLRAELVKLRGEFLIDKNIFIKEELEQAAAENREPNTSGYNEEMYLPQEAIEMWKQKILDQPILTKTLKYNFFT